MTIGPGAFKKKDFRGPEAKCTLTVAPGGDLGAALKWYGSLAKAAGIQAPTQGAVPVSQVQPISIPKGTRATITVASTYLVHHEPLTPPFSLPGRSRHSRTRPAAPAAR